MRIAIVFASDEGQTGRIAAYLVEEFLRGEAFAKAFHFRDLPAAWDPHDYDAVVVGASIHAGAYQPYALQWVREHREALNLKHNAFFCVSLRQKDVHRSPRSRAEVERYLVMFAQQTGWKPQRSASFAGALRYGQYSFFQRRFLRRLVPEDVSTAPPEGVREFTDWEAVTRFARDLLNAEPAPI